MININPATDAQTPALIESLPRLAPTVLSSWNLIGARNDPERRVKTRSSADFLVKLPLISPESKICDFI
jgi:hypothetical protein